MINLIARCEAFCDCREPEGETVQLEDVGSAGDDTEQGMNTVLQCPRCQRKVTFALFVDNLKDFAYVTALIAEFREKMKGGKA